MATLSAQTPTPKIFIKPAKIKKNTAIRNKVLLPVPKSGTDTTSKIKITILILIIQKGSKYFAE